MTVMHIELSAGDAIQVGDATITLSKSLAGAPA